MVSKRSAPLTKPEIFAVALAIVDTEGIDALSMRRLARDLGVEAMSLYRPLRYTSSSTTASTNRSYSFSSSRSCTCTFSTSPPPPTDSSRDL